MVLKYYEMNQKVSRTDGESMFIRGVGLIFMHRDFCSIG